MNAEVLIIGGGPAGAAAATLLAKQGVDVVLAERDATAKHKVCGEFLSREALFYLEELGISPGLLGAVPIAHVRLTRTRTVRHSPLPFAAMSLTRRRLDEALLHGAAAAGANVMRGCMVESLEPEQNGWKATLRGAEEIRARQVFVASGKHDLRGHARPAGRQTGLLALKMYWRLDPEQAAELDRHVELLLYRGGYAGLQPVEQSQANLCCLVQEREFRSLGGRWANFLDAMRRQSPHLDRRLHNAEPLLHQPLALSAIPYGFVSSSSDGLWNLGDQAAVIPSFTGDGMSLALHSGFLAAEMYAAGRSAAEYQSTFAAQIKPQVMAATALSKAMLHMPGACMLAAKLWPNSLRAIAQGTRIRPESLLAPDRREQLTANS